MREVACKACGGARLKPETLAVTINDRNISDGLRPVDRRGGQVPRRPRADRAGADDRRAGDQGGQRPARVPARRRPRLPDAVALGRHAGRRRGPAHPPGQPDRLRPGRHAVRARRAVDRPAPARQPAPHRHADPAARPRQHGHRRRARRGDDPRDATGSSTSGRVPASTAARVVYSGPVKGILKAKDSITGQYLSGRKIDPGAGACAAARAATRSIVQGAREHNLTDLDVTIPLGNFVAITGVSGSGKSTLIRDILLPVLMQRIYKSKTPAGKHRRITRHRAPRQGHRHGPVADRAHAALEPGDVHRRVRQRSASCSPRRTRPRSAATCRAASRFNVKGGRCEACAGDGTIKIEMHFLPDVYVPCEVCKGARYNRDTLDIEFKGKNIADVLDMPVAEGVDFFANQPSIARYMETLMDVGLGYVRLGQPAPTLSGGEAQRVKLATELAKRSTGHTIYLLDEPTTGLHFDDVRRLLDRAVTPRRPGQHGARDRAQPRRHQDRRLDHRPRSRGRQRRRHGRRRGHPEHVGHGRRQPHRPLPPRHADA